MAAEQEMETENIEKRKRRRPGKDIIVSQKEENKKKLYFPEDIIFDILMKLPADSIHGLRYVCKTWLKLIRTPIFIDSHLLKSEPGLIIGERNPEKENKYDIRFMAMEEGNILVKNLNLCCKERIVASCNGLLLLIDRIDDRVLHVANPITKQWERLPLANTSPCGVDSVNCGFTFVPSTKEYKVVRSFLNFKKGTISCEILTMGSNAWRQVEGPNVKCRSWYFSNGHISIKGVLHWKIFVIDEDDSHYMFSIDMSDEKYYTTRLPDCRMEARQFLETGGAFSIVGQANSSSPERLEWWVLMDLCRGEWERKCIISLHGLRDMDRYYFSPVLSLKNDKVIIFKIYRSDRYVYYYVYFESEKTRFMDLLLKEGDECFVHVNSLGWWKT